MKYKVYVIVCASLVLVGSIVTVVLNACGIMASSQQINGIIGAVLGLLGASGIVVLPKLKNSSIKVIDDPNEAIQTIQDNINDIIENTNANEVINDTGKTKDVSSNNTSQNTK